MKMNFDATIFCATYTYGHLIHAFSASKSHFWLFLFPCPSLTVIVNQIQELICGETNQINTYILTAIFFFSNRKTNRRVAILVPAIICFPYLPSCLQIYLVPSLFRSKCLSCEIEKERSESE